MLVCWETSGMGRPAGSAVRRFRRRRQNQIRKAARARTARPPTTPPAIAPVLEEEDVFVVFCGELEPLPEEVGPAIVVTVVPTGTPSEMMVVVTIAGPTVVADVDDVLLVTLVVLCMGPEK